jgi:hypothetical protein
MQAALSGQVTQGGKRPTASLALDLTSRNKTLRMAKPRPSDRRPTASKRFVDACWSVGTTTVSALLVAVIIYAVGQASGVNERIFGPDVTCSDFLSSEEAQAYVAGHPEVAKHLDPDRDGTPCETSS